jgi:hypothetical protein
MPVIPLLSIASGLSQPTYNHGLSERARKTRTIRENLLTHAHGHTYMHTNAHTCMDTFCQPAIAKLCRRQLPESTPFSQPANPRINMCTSLCIREHFWSLSRNSPA